MPAYQETEHRFYSEAPAFEMPIEIRAADGTRARATREDKNHRTMDLKTLSSQVHTMRPLSGKTGKE